MPWLIAFICACMSFALSDDGTPCAYAGTTPPPPSGVVGDVGEVGECVPLAAAAAAAAAAVGLAGSLYLRTQPAAASDAGRSTADRIGAGAHKLPSFASSASSLASAFARLDFFSFLNLAPALRTVRVLPIIQLSGT